MTLAPRIKELFDLPESVQRIQFVTRLEEAVSRPEETASTYVVTPSLALAFEKALRLVDTSLRDGRSQASYLHGSFGSGKSHFMALVCLLLRGDEHAWRHAELHALRERFSAVGSKKLLELEFHLVGEESLAHAIFGTYLRAIRESHPNAPLPLLFADGALFENALSLIKDVGEEAFFAKLDAWEGVGADGWGDFASVRWSRERFETLRADQDPKERGLLVTALVKTWFPAFENATPTWLPLDEGLGVLTGHAKALGYDGVLLFLDEIILWLASRVSNQAWFQNEVQQMVKLVEGQFPHAIPLVSFLARQRDLAEMVGATLAGAESAHLRDSLKWSEGRFETIELANENLPTIAEKRVLRARDDEAKAALAKSFDDLARRIGGDATWATLLGDAPATEFRRLYPFTPALVDALVALSNTLQRERTAIKLLTEILVEHAEDLRLGDVVGVGDLFDVVAGGEDAPSDVMRARFESAKQLYRGALLPLIQKAHGTTTPERCQRLRDVTVRLGCSNCPERACRADNRLIKTLLVAALVPEVATLKGLTASRLVQLNHGSLKVPIPGTEARILVSKLQAWASDVPQLHVGGEADPAVRVEIEFVDVESILDKARSADDFGARQRLVRDLLFQAMELEASAGNEQLRTIDWRGSRRSGHVRFGNVRTMPEEAFALPAGHDFRLVVDYPFDDQGFGPSDDEQKIDRLRDAGRSDWTLVWIPSFFSQAVSRTLGDLVVLEHVLASEASIRSYLAELSIPQQLRAREALTNMRNQKRGRVLRALEASFDLRTPGENDLDPSHLAERHLHLLRTGEKLTGVELPPSFADATAKYAKALLDARYPRHPDLRDRLTSGKVETLVVLFGRLVDEPDKRIGADKKDVELARATLAELGLVRTVESAILLVEDRVLDELERKRQRLGLDHPSVGDMRRLLDETGHMGLERVVEDLILRCYGRWSGRALVVGKAPFAGKSSAPLPDEVVLERPDLPSPADWAKALDRAETFGITFPGKICSGDALKKLEAALLDLLKSRRASVVRLPLALSRWLDLVNQQETDRLATARSADEMWSVLAGQVGRGLVEALARFEAKTSLAAVAKSVATATDVGATLDDALVYGPLAQAAARTSSEATALREQLGKALRQDEVVVALAPRLRELAQAGLREVAPAFEVPRAPPPAPGRVRRRETLDAQGTVDAAARLRALADAIERLTEVRVTGEVIIEHAASKEGDGSS